MALCSGLRDRRPTVAPDRTRCRSHQREGRGSNRRLRETVCMRPAGSGIKKRLTNSWRQHRAQPRSRSFGAPQQSQQDRRRKRDQGVDQRTRHTARGEGLTEVQTEGRGTVHCSRRGPPAMGRGGRRGAPGTCSLPRPAAYSEN